MTDVPDDRLLDQFARNASEEAFAALVQRHIALVHSVALRHTANPQHAEDITQAVFVILARKAGALGRKTVLPGWLYHAARLTAANLQRAEARRFRREREAFMQSKLEESPADALWRELSPQLDEAMAGLGTAERDALVLRYFQNKSMAEVAKFLGLEENTAQKRVSRALEKLRKFFTKRGMDSSTAAIAENISAHSVQTVPAALAKSVTAVALAKGATTSLSTLTLIKGALKIMALTKAKTAVVIGAAVLLTAGTTTLVVDKVVYKNAWADNPKVWATDSRVLDKNPAGVFIFRPTRFPNTGGGVWSGDRMVAKNYSVRDLVDNAYGYSQVRTVFPPDMPREHFDVMSTMTGGSEMLVKNELKKRFRLTAYPETRDADVLLLKVQNPNPSGLKPHIGDNGNSSSMSSGNGKIAIQNQQLSSFLGNLESRAGVPVLDETGLPGRYDLQLQWKSAPGESDKDAFLRAVREQLGLELVPTNRPIEMLVVEKVK